MTSNYFKEGIDAHHYRERERERASNVNLLSIETMNPKHGDFSSTAFMFTYKKTGIKLRLIQY